jgi:hypothetical protein
VKASLRVTLVALLALLVMNLSGDAAIRSLLNLPTVLPYLQ